MRIWQNTLRDIWYHYSVVTAVELRVLLQTTLLRGWEASIMCGDSLMPVLVMIALLCFVRDTETGPMVAIAALMVLMSRPSVGLKNMRAIMWSEKTLVMIVWGLCIASMWDSVLYVAALVERYIPQSYIWIMPHIAWVSKGILLIPCGIVPFSPWCLVVGLWVLDTVPGICTYQRAIYNACVAVLHSIVFFFIVYVLLVLPILSMLIEVLQYLLPLQLSRCCAALIIAPWYGAVVGSWYIYIRYR